ncbi:MAG: hypothetical protein ABSA32_13210 [Candidatus Acidiferrales bacterium]|jgi:hypothetical protein
MRALLGFAVSSILLVGVPSNAWTKPNTAFVSITINDGLGGTLTGAKVTSFKNLISGRDFAGRFHENDANDLSASGIPYGKYDLKFDQPGFPEAERPVNVSEEEVFIDACVRTATVHIVPVLGTGEAIDGITWGAHSLSAANRSLKTMRMNIELFNSVDDDSDLADHFVGAAAPNIPYGQYELHIDCNFGLTTMRPVDVYQLTCSPFLVQS